MLATVTSGVVAVTGTLSVGGLFAIVPGFFLVGAILEPRFPQLGKGLMAMGALFVTVIVVPLAIAMGETVIFKRDFIGAGIVGLWMLSAGFVIWCDIWLVLFGVRARKARGANVAQSA